MRKVRKIKIATKKYKIWWGPIPDYETFDRKGRVKRVDKVFGVCQSPKNAAKDRIILVNTKQTDKQLLNTLIHECFGHGYHWGWSEKKVIKFANQASDLLWKIGYRLRK